MNRIREILSLPAPREYARSVQDIHYERLKRLGFRTLLFDYDNTLAPWKSIIVDDKTLKLFDTLLESGFQISVVTNAPCKRARQITERYKGQVPVFGSMKKPGIRNLSSVVDAINADPAKTVIIGDLFLTDIIAGNRMKMYTIMVNPYQEGVISFLGKMAKWLTKITHSVFYYTIGWFFHLSEMISPNEFKDSVYDIDFRHLKESGFDTVVFDLDNTLARWKSRVLGDRLITFLNEVRLMGYRVLILSNSTNIKRIRLIRDQLGDAFMISGRMRKPFPGRMRAILRKSLCEPQKTMVIGDQLFTDVFVGNIIRAYTIKVNPLYPQYEFFGTRVLRFFERALARSIKIKPKIPNPHPSASTHKGFKK